MLMSLLYVGIRAIINEPEWGEEYKVLKGPLQKGFSNWHNTSYVLDELTEVKWERTVWGS